MCGLKKFGFKSSKMVGEVCADRRSRALLVPLLNLGPLRIESPHIFGWNAANCAEIGPRFVGKVRRTHRAQGTPGESKSEERSGPAERR